MHTTFIRFMLCALLCALSAPAWAALAVNGTISVLNQTTAVNPLTFTHTTVAGTNLLVVACVTTSSASFSSATFNGETMAEELQANLSSMRLVTYRLVTPPIGSSLTVSVTMSSSRRGGCYAVNLSGADTTTPLTATESMNSSGGSTSSLSHSFTCATGNIALGVGGIAAVRTPTVTTGAPIMTQNDTTVTHFGAYTSGIGASTILAYSWTGGNATHHHMITCVNAAAAVSAPRRSIIHH